MRARLERLVRAGRRSPVNNKAVAREAGLSQFYIDKMRQGQRRTTQEAVRGAERAVLRQAAALISAVLDDGEEAGD